MGRGGRFAFVPRVKPGAVATSLGQDGRAGFLADVPWPKLLDDSRPGRNVVFVLDASASMEDPKLRWLQTAVGRVLKALRGEDRFAVVVARGDVDLWRGGELARADAQTASSRTPSIRWSGSRAANATPSSFPSASAIPM